MDMYLFFQFISFLAAPLKNAIDWASVGPNCWGNKAAAVASAGGGFESFDDRRSHDHLRQVGVFLDLHFINKPKFLLNTSQDPAKFDSDGNLIDAEAKEKLKGVLVALRDFTLRLKNQRMKQYMCCLVCYS